MNTPAYDTELTNIAWRDMAAAMRAVDPTIKLIGPDIHQFTGDPAVDPRDAVGRDWLRTFLEANGDLVDIVAIHRYPFPSSNTNPIPSIDDLRQNSREWETIIPNLRAIVQEITGCDLPIAVTEINSNWSNAGGGEATPDSFYNAIWWADVLGRLIRQRVDIVAHFALQSKPGLAGWGLLARNEVRPTYYVYQMYRHFGQELVHAASDDPDLTIYAARRDDGALTVMIINLGSVEKEQVLHLQNVKTGTAQRWLFDKNHQAERVPDEIMTGRDSVVLPAQSIMLYVLPDGP